MAGQKTQCPDFVCPIFPKVPTTDHPSSLTVFLLARLSRLLHLLDEWESRVTANDWHLRLIHKVVYSTYCDCKAAGIQREAQQLVEQHRRAHQEQVEFTK